MARAALAVALVVLVVASGCLTAEPTGTTEPETPSTSAPFVLPDRTIDREQNPWHVEPIEVVVENPSGLEADVHPELMRALNYWEDAIDPGQRYQPEFRLVDHSDSPEIRVEVVQTVEGCGVHEDSVALGCAPVIPRNATVTDPVTVQMRAGHTDAMTAEILKHELGHVLGYEHGEGPGDVMAGNLSARSPGNVVDAVNRKYPWGSDWLTVAVVSENGTSSGQMERVERALEFYEGGAEGTVAAPPTFDVVADPEDADIVVGLSDGQPDCDIIGPEQSCAHWDGPDVDDDGDPEYITDAHIVIGPSGHQYVAWHVGYWLGWTLWTNGIPEPFLTDQQEQPDRW